MTTRIRRTLVLACLAALALPAAAAAAPTQVAPPGAESDEAVSAAAVSAAANPGCSAVNTINFNPARVRHSAVGDCNRVAVRIECTSVLFHNTDRISGLSARGDNHCKVASSFADSAAYPPGESFTQDYRYKLTLKNRRKQWAGTTESCPKRNNDRRTLICNGSHSTTSPIRADESF